MSSASKPLRRHYDGTSPGPVQPPLYRRGHHEGAYGATRGQRQARTEQPSAAHLRAHCCESMHSTETSQSLDTPLLKVIPRPMPVLASSIGGSGAVAIRLRVQPYQRVGVAGVCGEMRPRRGKGGGRRVTTWVPPSPGAKQSSIYLPSCARLEHPLSKFSTLATTGCSALYVTGTSRVV